MRTNERRIVVIGGGIGGLTLAIALSRYGLNIEIYEQAAELREVGAAVALSANATRFFEQFGLGSQFASRSCEVSALVYRDGRSGRIIGEHQAGLTYCHRFGAPYVGIHRAELQAILSAAVGLNRIQLGKRLVGIDDTGARAVLRFDDGSTTEADLVVGADGARSFVRRWMLGYDDALYSGCSEFRGVVSMDKLPRLPHPTAIQFWIGPGGHLLHYPMGDNHINFLLVERHPTPWPRRTGSCQRPKVSNCGTSHTGIRRWSR
jgi:salicylate hydroxylase